MEEEDLVDLAPHQAPEDDREPEWTLASSSNVAAFRRRDRNLEVWFHNGGVYEYVGAGYLYDAMNNAPSKGQFVWQVLRGRGKARGVGFLYNRIG